MERESGGEDTKESNKEKKEQTKKRENKNMNDKNLEIENNRGIQEKLKINRNKQRSRENTVK